MNQSEGKIGLSPMPKGRSWEGRTQQECRCGGASIAPLPPPSPPRHAIYLRHYLGLDLSDRASPTDDLFTDKSFLSFVKSNRIQIVTTIFQLIWYQTEFRWVLNRLEKCNYSPQIGFDLTRLCVQYSVTKKFFPKTDTFPLVTAIPFNLYISTGNI